LEVLVSSVILSGIMTTTVLLLAWGTWIYGQDASETVAERNMQGALEQLAADIRETAPVSVKTEPPVLDTTTDAQLEDMNAFVMMYSARNAANTFMAAPSGSGLAQDPAWQGIVAYRVILPDEDGDGVEDPDSVGTLVRYEHIFGTQKTFQANLTLPAITRLTKGTTTLADDVFRIDIGDATTFVYFNRDGTPYGSLTGGDIQRNRRIIGQYQRLTLDTRSSPFVVSLVGWWASEKGTGVKGKKVEGRLVAKHILCRSKN
jgi:hypothetical protein